MTWKNENVRFGAKKAETNRRCKKIPHSIWIMQLDERQKSGNQQRRKLAELMSVVVELMRNQLDNLE